MKGLFVYIVVQTDFVFRLLSDTLIIVCLISLSLLVLILSLGVNDLLRVIDKNNALNARFVCLINEATLLNKTLH